MNSNKIQLNETVYEIQRVYSGTATVADIIKQRLTSHNYRKAPLTSSEMTVYNNISEVGMLREVK